MATVKDLLDIARAELGTKESPAGSNRVKYADWYGMPGQPWCVMFVMWVFHYAKVSLPTRTASCTTLMRAAKAADCWVTSGYRVGDIVIYDFDGDKTPEHCGIVESVLSGGYATIEGNTAVGNDSNGGEVMKRVRRPKQILGAVRPLYDEPYAPTEVELALSWARESGVMTGYADGEMRLDDPVTRRQLLLVAYRLWKMIEGQKK